MTSPKSTAANVMEPLDSKKPWETDPTPVRVRIRCPGCHRWLWAPGVTCGVPKSKRALKQLREESMARGRKLRTVMGLDQYDKLRESADQDPLLLRCRGAISMVWGAVKLIFKVW